MAIALPPFDVDGTYTTTHIPAFAADGTFSTTHLPTYLADGTFVAGGMYLPPSVFAGRTAFFLPKPLVGVNSYVIPVSGGVLVGGRADVVGDPFIPFGGVAVGGAAPVTFWQAVAPVGGVQVGGAAVVSAVLIQVYRLSDENVPQGGFTLGGGAVIQEAIKFIATGGAQVGGDALIQDNIPFTGSGAVAVGGASEVLFTAQLTSDGGVVMTGAAPLSFVSREVPSGGARVGGSAVVTFRESYVLPTGGVQIGGTAVAYMLASGSSSTTENPFGDDFPGWAVNLDNFAPSRYLGLAANSMTQFMGQTFVANAGGVYEVGADSDAGHEIKASIQFPTTDYGDSRVKYMEVAYIGVRTTGKMRLKVLVSKQHPQYYMIAENLASPKGTRVPIGKGLRGRYWGVRLDNVDGGDFELESIEFNPVAGQRHGA